MAEINGDRQQYLSPSLSAVNPSESNDSQESAEAIDELAARREDLAITIHDLDVSKPSILVSLVGLQLSLVFLIGALALVVVPYFRPQFPRQVSTIAAFAAVILAFVAYLSFRKFSIDYDQRRLYQNLIRRAKYLARLADDLLSARSSESGARHDA